MLEAAGDVVFVWIRWATDGRVGESRGAARLMAAVISQGVKTRRHLCLSSRFRCTHWAICDCFHCGLFRVCSAIFSQPCQPISQNQREPICIWSCTVYPLYYLFIASVRETKEVCSNPTGGGLIHCTVGLKNNITHIHQNLCHSSKMISEDLGQRSH